MKRFICLALITIFMLTQCVITASAADVTILGKDTISQIEGEGYHDVNGYPFSRFVSGNDVILHSGDWAAYDISALASGTYEVFVKGGASRDTTFTLSADGRNIISTGAFAQTGGYLTYQERSIGQMYVRDGASVLKVENFGNSVYLAQIRIRFVSSDNLTLIYEKTFNALDVAGGAGVGFYDNPDAGGSVRGLEPAYDNVVLRWGEWVSYDVSAFVPGTYKVTLDISNSSAMNISVSLDGTQVEEEVIIPGVGGYDRHRDVMVALVEMSGDQAALRFTNKPSSGACYLRSIKIEQLDALEFEELTANAGKTDELISRGSDILTVRMSTSLNPETVNTKTVKLYDASGAQLKYTVSADDKNINIKLSDSLKESSNYTITLEGIGDIYNQSIEEAVTVPFETTDTTDVRGESSLLIDSFEKTENSVTIKGRILSSFGEGINGRKAFLYIAAPEAAEQLQDEDLSQISNDIDGAFELTHTFANDSAPGRYAIRVSAEMIGTAGGYTNSILYYAPYFSEQFAYDFSNLTEVGQVEEKVFEYIDFLEVDMTDAAENISDLNAVYEKLLNRTFGSAEDVVDAFKDAVYFEYIRQATQETVITEILSDSDKVKYFESFAKNSYDELSATSKQAFTSFVLNASFETEEDFSEIANEQINTLLKEQYNISTPTATISSDSVLAGENVRLDILASVALSDVSSIHLELYYTEESKNLFESGRVSVEADGMTPVISAENGIMSIDLTAEEGTVSISSRICTVVLFASGKTAGIHTVSASASALFHPSGITDENVNIYSAFANIGNATISVEAITGIDILAKDIYDNTPNVGFYDNPAAGGSVRGLEVEVGRVILRASEWSAYNIGGLSAGRYEVSINHSNSADTNFDVLVDDKTTVSAKRVVNTGSYSAERKTALGTIEADGDQAVLKIKNSGSGATYISTVEIIKIEDFDITEIKIYPETLDGSVARGSDKISVSFSNDVDIKSANSENVFLADASGKKISADIVTRTDSNTGKTALDLLLKETLGFDTAYTFHVKSTVSDRFAQTLAEDFEKSFVTGGISNDSGAASVSVDKWNSTNGTFTVSGRVLSSQGVGISGRKISISGGFGSGEKVLWKDALSGENGAFTLTYEFAQDSISGEYSVDLITEYMQSAYAGHAYFFTEEVSQTIAQDFSGKETVQDVVNTLNTHAAMLGINVSELSQEIDITPLASAFLNRTFESADEISEELGARVVLEKVNQSSNAQGALDLINDIKEFSKAGEIKRERWIQLSSAEQLAIVAEIKVDGRVETPSELCEKIDDKTDAYLMARCEITAPSVIVTVNKANVGQTLCYTLTAPVKQENVTGLHIEVAFSQQSAALFKSNPEITLSKHLSSMVVSERIEENKIVYDISLAQAGNEIKTIFFRNEFITLSFLAVNGTEGTHQPTISGYVTYYKGDKDNDADNNTANDIYYFADVNMQIPSIPAVSVAKVTTSDDTRDDYVPGSGSLGGSGGGGNGAAGGTSGGFPATVPVEAPKAPEFTDMQSVPWALEAVTELSKLGIITGREETSYAPLDEVTRAEFCKLIVLACNIYDSKAEHSFTDMQSDAWYEKFIASAYQAGIVAGDADGRFNPDSPITREDMAVMVLRSAKLKNISYVSAENFVDDSEISDYAKEAVCAIRGMGITDGVGDNKFAPKTTVNRAMAAKIVYMLMSIA